MENKKQTNKEFKLSDKVKQIETDFSILDVKDVKEFIKRLKEMTKKWEQGKFSIIVWEAWIDKLAGDELSEGKK